MTNKTYIIPGLLRELYPSEVFIVKFFEENGNSIAMKPGEAWNRLKKMETLEEFDEPNRILDGTV